MPVIKFNSRTVDDSTPVAATGRPIDYWGKDEDGLGLRVGPKGKTWLLNIRKPGAKSSSRVIIGRFPELGLREARHKAGDRRSELRAGRPTRSASQYGADSLTWAQASAEYLAAKKRRPATLKFYTNILARKPMADWNGKAITQLTRGFVDAELSKVAAPSMQNRMRDFVVAVLRRVSQKRDGYQAFTFSGDVYHEETPRERKLTDAELVKVWAVLDAQGPRFALVFRLLILLGSRVGETLMMQWSDLDLQAGTWTVPPEHTKSKRGYVIYLPTQGVGMLREFPRWKGTDHVFSADGRRAPTLQLKFPAAKIAKASGVKGWTPHDLRRTFRSGLDRLKIEPHISELCMNHSQAVLVQTYSSDLSVYADRLRAAWQAYADHVYALYAQKAEA